MKRKVLISLIVVIIGLVCLTFSINFKGKNSNQEDKNFSCISLSMENLDINFLKLENKNNNVVYSPLSIKYALNMLRDGANGNTLRELDNLLGYSKVNKYTKVSGKIGIANAAFIRSDYKGKIKDSYIKTLKNKYNAEIKYDIDKDVINKWVEDNTFKLIKEILTDEDMTADGRLRLALVNALAINMEWITPFNGRSAKGIFNKKDGTKMEATMMHLSTNSHDHSYYIDDEITIFRKDLKSVGDVGLEVVFIEPKGDIDKFVNDIDSKTLKGLLNKTHSFYDKDANLNITLPKFTYEYKISLKNDLQKLGINDLFNNEEVDLTKIYKNPGDNASVDDIIHKAKIEMSELGVKASAATAAITNDGISAVKKDRDVDLIFDRPFMYLIKSKRNENIWFIGVVNEPAI